MVHPDSVSYFTRFRLMAGIYTSATTVLTVFYIFPFSIQYEDFDQLIKASLHVGRKHAPWSCAAGPCFETSQYSLFYNWLFFK